MTRLLLASALAVSALVATPSAQADCNLSGCIEYVCGSKDRCGPVERCYYWTDYPTCLYR